MGFLDKVKDTAKQVGDKAQELGDKGKEKFEDHKLLKQIEEHKTEIGDLVYAERTGTGSPEAEARITELVTAITAALAQIEANGAAAEAAAATEPAAATATPAADAPAPPPPPLVPPADS